MAEKSSLHIFWFFDILFKCEEIFGNANFFNSLTWIIEFALEFAFLTNLIWVQKSLNLLQK